MLTVVTWKWGTKFTARHVNVLRAMVARNLKLPHRFVCMTNDAAGIHKDISIVGIPPDEYGDDRFCLKRLWIFSGEAGFVLGSRFVQMDLDTVIIGDITPLLDRSEDFVVWKAPYYDPVHHACNGPPTCYNASLILMSGGSRTKVWRRYCEAPRRALKDAEECGFVYHGDSDIVSHMLMPNEATWDERGGLYAFWTHLDKGAKKPPSNARMISFYGRRNDPADSHIRRRCPWVGEHWRE